MQNHRRFRNGWSAKDKRGNKNKHNCPDNWARWCIAGSHRTMIVTRHALAIAIASILLKIATLAVMYGAISRIAARQQIGC